MTDEEKAYEKIGAALDRLHEAHFWIHMMEEHYHKSDLFRWYLNVFLKAIKEIPQLITMAMQNTDGFKDWYKPKIEELNNDPLMKKFSKDRDIIVHKDMLFPESFIYIGITEGRGMKFGRGLKLDPRWDSDDLILRVAENSKDNDFTGIMSPDEESMPCVEREWKIKDFDEELVDLCAKAWMKTGVLIADLLKWQGFTAPSLSLDCRHGSEKVKIKLYSRMELWEKTGYPVPDGYEE